MSEQRGAEGAQRTRGGAETDEIDLAYLKIR